jgi:hypothetical protein
MDNPETQVARLQDRRRKTNTNKARITIQKNKRRAIPAPQKRGVGPSICIWSILVYLYHDVLYNVIAVYDNNTFN